MKFKDLKMIESKHPNGVKATVQFGPDYELSIVKNEMSYGGKSGLYEIGVFKGNGMVEMPGITEPGDTVRGYLTEEKIDFIIESMSSLTKREPTQR